MDGWTYSKWELMTALPFVRYNSQLKYFIDSSPWQDAWTLVTSKSYNESQFSNIPFSQCTENESTTILIIIWKFNIYVLLNALKWILPLEMELVFDRVQPRPSHIVVSVTLSPTHSLTHCQPPSFHTRLLRLVSCFPQLRSKRFLNFPSCLYKPALLVWNLSVCFICTCVQWT